MPNAVRYAWGSFAGSLITADYALEQGKSVFAVPGRVGDACSAGCNMLIAQGAGIAWGPEVILEELFRGQSRKGPEKKGKERAGSGLSGEMELSEAEWLVLKCLDSTEQSLETITGMCALEVSAAASALTMLCMNGLAVSRIPGYYCRSEEWEQ